MGLSITIPPWTSYSLTLPRRSRTLATCCAPVRRFAKGIADCSKMFKICRMFSMYIHMIFAYLFTSHGTMSYKSIKKTSESYESWIVCIHQLVAPVATYVIAAYSSSTLMSSLWPVPTVGSLWEIISCVLSVHLATGGGTEGCLYLYLLHCTDSESGCYRWRQCSRRNKSLVCSCGNLHV